jgi:hypothetical protein
VVQEPRRHPRHRPRARSTAQNVWIGVGSLLLAAILLALALYFILSESRRTRSSNLPRDMGAQETADRLISEAHSLPRVRAIVGAARPAVLAEALRQIAHHAATALPPLSADAQEVLARIASDPPDGGLPPDAQRAAVSALCQVIRETLRADTAAKARDSLIPLLPSGVPVPPAATGDLSAPADRAQAARALEKAILGRLWPSGESR